MPRSPDESSDAALSPRQRPGRRILPTRWPGRRSRCPGSGSRPAGRPPPPRSPPAGGRSPPSSRGARRRSLGRAGREGRDQRAPSSTRCGLPSASARSPRAVGSAPIRLTTTTLREPAAARAARHLSAVGQPPPPRAAQAGVGDFVDHALRPQMGDCALEAGVAAMLARTKPGCSDPPGQHWRAAAARRAAGCGSAARGWPLRRRRSCRDQLARPAVAAAGAAAVRCRSWTRCRRLGRVQGPEHQRVDAQRRRHGSGRHLRARLEA